MNGARELAHVFHPTLLEEFENLPIPLVVFEGVNFVVFGLNEIREHPVGQRHGGDGHGASTLGFDDVEARLGQHGGFVPVGVHVRRNDDGGDAVVGIEQGQSNDGTHVDGEAFVVHTSALQAPVSIRIVPRMSKLGIDVEGVRNRSQIVEVVVNHHPFRVWVGLDLVPDDGRPRGRIDDEKVGVEIANCLGGFVESVAQISPSGVLIGSQHRVWVDGHHERGDHAPFAHCSFTSWA